MGQRHDAMSEHPTRITWIQLWAKAGTPSGREAKRRHNAYRRRARLTIGFHALGRAGVPG